MGAAIMSGEGFLEFDSLISPARLGDGLPQNSFRKSDSLCTSERHWDMSTTQGIGNRSMESCFGGSKKAEALRFHKTVPHGPHLKFARGGQARTEKIIIPTMNVTTRCLFHMI